MVETKTKLDIHEGGRYGRLVVSKILPGYKVECQCDCGQAAVVNKSNIAWGRSRSCGCVKGKELPPGVAQINSVYNRYQRQAKARGIEFALSRCQFDAIIRNECHFCGAEPKFRRKKEFSSGAEINGVDRVDNNRGYLMENCVPCCAVCNRAKSDMSVEQFTAWVTAVHGRLT